MSFREESTYKILHKDCLDKARVKAAIEKTFLEDKYLPDYLVVKNVFVKKKNKLYEELGLK